MTRNLIEPNVADPQDYESLVSSLYRSLLVREPDPGGHAAHVDALRKGRSIVELIQSFVTSDEFAERQRREARRLLATMKTFSAPSDDDVNSAFPPDFDPPGEAGRSYRQRRESGFLDRYCSGSLILDVGFSGYDNPSKQTALPGAIGVDLDYPGYDGRVLPFGDATVDTIFSSHCLEHILYDLAVIRDWYRTLKIGGFIVCIVPSQALYEKRRFLPSRFNEDHKRMYTPSSLVGSFEQALEVNSYRVRHLAENDRGFNYRLGPDVHSEGAYEIELVIEKIKKPDWSLA